MKTPRPYYAPTPTEGARGPGSGTRFALAAVCTAVAIIFAGTHFQVVPTASGDWRGIAAPPTLLQLALAIVFSVVAAIAALRLPWRSTRLLQFGALAALPFVPVVTGWGQGLLFFQGPVLMVAFGAVAALMIARRRRERGLRVRPVILFGIAIVVFVLLGMRLPGSAGPQGDEPHYLLMTHSLLADGDVDLTNDFANRAYTAFYPGLLHAHTSPRSPEGRIYPVHTPGLPALLAPGYAAAGYFGARLVMALMAAAAAALTYRLAREVTGHRGPAIAVWLGLVLTAPFALYAVSIYPEMVAALATAVFLLTSRKDPSPAGLLAASVLAATLPWIHPKFLPLAAVGLFLTVARRGPRPWRFGAVLLFAASIAGLLVFFRSIYGAASLSAAYGPGYADDVSLLRVPRGVLGFLFDRQYGLGLVSPFWLLAIPGVVLLWRARLGDAARAILLALSTLVVGASFSMWWGGASPPGRFVVPALPALAVFAAAAAQRRGEAAAGLLGVGAAVVAVAAAAPRALHNRGDGESALLGFLSPVLDLDGRLPSLVVDPERGIVLSLCLFAALAMAWHFRVRGLLAGAVGYALVSTSLAAGPLLDPRGATLQLLRTWRAPKWSATAAPPHLADLSLPVDLPDAPWVIAAGEVRYTRRFELPAGGYRLTAAPRPVVPGAARAFIRVVAGDHALADAEWRPGAPVGIEVTIGSEHRRLQVTAGGLEGRIRIASMRLIPQSLAP